MVNQSTECLNALPNLATVSCNDPTVQSFTEAVMSETLARMQADKDYKRATEDTEIQKPEKLVDLVKWTRFWELFTTYLGRFKGAALTPLSYLVRDHTEVTDDIRTAEYASVQEKLIATTALSGAHFDLDNRTLYDEFKPLVVDGPGWSFIKRFDKAKDERAAVLALKTQAEGTIDSKAISLRLFSELGLFRSEKRVHLCELCDFASGCTQ